MKKSIALVLAAMLFAFCVSGAFAESPALKVSVPNGAPALALAAWAVENSDAFTIVAADTIAAEFASEQADFIIAPVNAGAKLYNAGKSTYKLAAVVTWGNLYFASHKENFTCEDMNGKKVVLFGENTINASVALYAMEKNGCVPGEVEYLGSAAETQALLLNDTEAFVLTAEPALTAAAMKDEKVTSISLNEMLKNANGFDGYCQAGLFVKSATLETQPDMVKSFMEETRKACALCSDDVEKAAEYAVSLEILPNAKVAVVAIPRCAIRFVSAKEAKEQLEMTANIDLAQFGGAVPAEDFYYEAE